MSDEFDDDGDETLGSTKRQRLEYVQAAQRYQDYLDDNPEYTQQRQARWQADIQAIHEGHALERKARARGERVPSLLSDPEAYVVWLQQQRQLPYVEMARDLNEQSRHSRGGLR